MENNVNTQDILNAIPEDRHEAVLEQARVIVQESRERITNESLKQSAQKLLEDYYEERDKLVDQIKIFQEALDTAKSDLKELNKNNKNLLKQTGGYFSYSESIYNLVRDNPGKTHGELMNLSKDNEALMYRLHLSGLGSVLANFVLTKIIKREEGKYYVINTFKGLNSKGITEQVIEILKDGPKTANVIKSNISDSRNINISTIHTSLRNLKIANKVSSNQSYKNQRNVVYTWIGEK